MRAYWIYLPEPDLVAETGGDYYARGDEPAVMTVAGQSFELTEQAAVWADSRMIRQELSLPSAFKPYQQEALKRLDG